VLKCCSLNACWATTYKTYDPIEVVVRQGVGRVLFNLDLRPHGNGVSAEL